MLDGVGGLAVVFDAAAGPFVAVDAEEGPVVAFHEVLKSTESPAACSKDWALVFGRRF